jgi:predicted transcriptional regulator of viral defense system
MPRSNFQKRFSQIAASNERVFHADDLANLWQITNENTLRITLKRYVDQGLLFRIKKGLFSLEEPHKVDAWLLGVKFLHRWAYISTESVLTQQGIINQQPSQITLVSGVSRRFSVGGRNYYSRQLQKKYLFNSAGIKKDQNAKVFVATLERAVADMLYFNPHFYFDGQRLINWHKVGEIQEKVGYGMSSKIAP